MNEQSLGAGVEVVRNQNQGSFLEVLWVATRLGLTSFGGPIAHLGYFHEEYVKRKNGSMSKAMPILWLFASSSRSGQQSGQYCNWNCPCRSRRRLCRVAGFYVTVSSCAYSLRFRHRGFCERC